jgi:M6 family metalloprotease-like protein
MYALVFNKGGTMKHLILLLLAVCISPVYFSNAQTENEFICPEFAGDELEEIAQTGGLYKPSSNLPGQYFRALFVFVQFEGDDRPNSGWDPDELPDWAFDFVDSEPVTQGNEYRDMTFSDYWKEMSLGSFDFIGDIYPELVILPPQSYYQQNNKNFSDCNLDVLAEIDDSVDFSLYENWKLQSGQFIFSPGIADNLVDMIYIIYRNPDSWFNTFTAAAYLGFSGNVETNDSNQNGSIKINGGLYSSGSGITVREGLRGHYNLIETCAHEFGHYLFGYDHTNWGGIMGGNTYALSGWERAQLDYVTFTTVNQDNFTITLSDFISTGDILKIPIPITNPNSTNYFLVENHQRLSHYDQITRGGSLNGQYVLETTVGAGIYITLNYNANDFYALEVYPRVADGDFDWVYDGDFYAGPGFSVGEPWQGYVPKTKRVAVNRTSGKNDRMPQHIYWNNHWASKWCDIDNYGNYWLSRDVMGDDTDPFTLTNNDLFSPWSNPSSYSSLTGGATNFSVWVYNQNGNNISLQVKTTENSSLSLPPSKPQNLQMTIVNNHPKLTWEANIEPDLAGYNIYRLENGWILQQIGYVANGSRRLFTDYSANTSIPSDNYDYYIKAVDSTALLSVSSNIVSVMALAPKISVGESNKIPSVYNLEANYPNPFNPTTTIKYAVPKESLVSIKIYNSLGQKVADLLNENQIAGYYELEFDASTLPSGVYFYQMQAGNYVETKKMMLMK